MAGKAGGDDDMIADINMTPFVDVVLVLLIIFMVTARLMIAPSIPVKLPQASTGEETKSSPVAVTITRAKDGNPEKFYLNGKLVEQDKIGAILAEKVKKKGKKAVQVIIAADKAVPHGKVMWLLDLLRRLGVEDYAFNIDPAAAASP